MQDITITCPKCESKNIVKRGRRKGKFRNKQLYECKKCGRRFTEPSLENMIHSPKVIYHALNCYHAGLTFEQSSKKVNRKFKVKTSKSTIHSWINMFQKFCPVYVMRENFADHKNILFTKRFEHENLDYLFMYHRYKLDALAKKNFLGLTKYITSFQRGCPDVFFEVGKRCSKPMFKVNVKTRQQFNLACKIAAFAVQAAGNNLQRHKIVEKFMIINDAATVACEVPVWYWDKKIDTGITGHIDMIQVRNGSVYILDYKPNASKDKNAANQLYHYASALAYRANIPLSKIRCAWFDEKAYFEYLPQDASVKIMAVI